MCLVYVQYAILITSVLKKDPRYMYLQTINTLYSHMHRVFFFFLVLSPFVLCGFSIERNLMEPGSLLCASLQFPRPRAPSSQNDSATFHVVPRTLFFSFFFFYNYRKTVFQSLIKQILFSIQSLSLRATSR